MAYLVQLEIALVSKPAPVSLVINHSFTRIFASNFPAPSSERRRLTQVFDRPRYGDVERSRWCLAVWARPQLLRGHHVDYLGARHRHLAILQHLKSHLHHAELFGFDVGFELEPLGIRIWRWLRCH